MPRSPLRFWTAAMVVAWAVDFLFWEKPAGISFFIFVVLTLLTGFVLASVESARPARLSLLLSGLVIIMAGATIVRSEPFSRVLNGFLALLGMALLARTFHTGGWIRFGLLSYIITFLDLLNAGLVRAASLRLVPAEKNGSPLRDFFRRALPVLRGLILALPVVAVLAALLASADLVFADQLNHIIENFNIERLPEYTLRFLFILLMAYLLAGLYVQAVLPRKWIAPLPGDDQAEAPEPSTSTGESSAEQDVPVSHPVVAAPPAHPGRFLGAVEAFVILFSVNLLFLSFVGVQFRYFFGGQTNISTTAYTYSEYARRGFFELVWVAVISLLLWLVLSAITHLHSTRSERTFTALTVLLFSLVIIILVSAFQRLLLYENAYGFTRLRTYTHILIPWLGFLLLAAIALQVSRREQFFGGVLLLTTAGFGLTFCLLNVDGLIVHQNVNRARQGAELDGQYLISLSEDALPALVAEYSRADQPPPVRSTLGLALACRVSMLAETEPLPWQSYHPGRAAAAQSLVRVDLRDYRVNGSGEELVAASPAGMLNCATPRFID